MVTLSRQYCRVPSSVVLSCACGVPYSYTHTGPQLFYNFLIPCLLTDLTSVPEPMEPKLFWGAEAVIISFSPLYRIYIYYCITFILEIFGFQFKL